MVRARIRSRHKVKSLRSGRLRAWSRVIIRLAQGPRILFRLPGCGYSVLSQSRVDRFDVDGLQFHALADLFHRHIVPWFRPVTPWDGSHGVTERKNRPTPTASANKS